MLAPLDAAARREVEAAARQVATVTALVPLALADVAAALTANVRMIRRIAEIYGGRSGTLGSWRLTRAVITRTSWPPAPWRWATTCSSRCRAAASWPSSRAASAKGVVNGALTARVGIAAMEVCRPLPFHAVRRPSVRGIIRTALAGLVPTGKG